MTKKIMLINETDDESRVAIVEDNLLQEMLIEHRTVEQMKNNIYKGTVVQVQSSLQAAFVDFGNKKHGFLPSSEINPSIYQRKNLNNNSPIQQKLKKGQTILVQVTREAVDQKGAALTTNVSLPGRFMVLMPNSNKGGVSKRIEDGEERERLKSFIAAIETEKHSIIIRTAGIGRDLVELKKDYTALKKTWEEILRSFKETKAPSLILEEADVVTRTLRDYYAEDIEEIWVDNPETFQKALGFLKQAAPRRQKDLKLFVGDRSLFSSYKIERQVEQLTSRDIKLSSGGSIVIDQTEALVAIDVNSGRSNQEGDIDATALRTNLEAAREIARQLRLRNLGGLIVIDFIDMESEKSRRKVEEELQNAMSRDKAQRKYNPISQFGLLEMSRQRLSVGISNTVESVCPICHGKGRIPSLLASTNLILRSIRETAARGNLEQIEGVLPLELANHLLNERRQSITDLELEFGIDIILRGSPEITVFNESQLKSTFTQKTQHGRGEGDARKDGSKADDDRRRQPQKEKERDWKGDGRDKQKEPAEKRQDGRKQKLIPEIEAEIPDDNEPEIEMQDDVEPEIEMQDDVEPEAEIQDDTEPEAEIQDEAEPEAEIQDDRQPEEQEHSDITITAPVSRERIPAGGRDGSIHPGALFSNVKEIEAEELAVITSSFENRLKGKPDNQPPQVIDRKYLWKNPSAVEETRKSAPAADFGEEYVHEAEVADPVQKSELPESGNPAQAEAAAATPQKSDSGKKTSGRRKSRRRPAKKSGNKPATQDPASKETEPAQQRAVKTDTPAQDAVIPAQDDAAAGHGKTAQQSGSPARRGRSRKHASKKAVDKNRTAQQTAENRSGQHGGGTQNRQPSQETAEPFSAKHEPTAKHTGEELRSAEKPE